MKIMTFSAADMRQGMDKVSEALGPDVVILETRDTSHGVEIVAATDFDPDNWTPDQAPPLEPPRETAAPPAMVQSSSAAPAPLTPEASLELNRLRDEMNAMRGLLQDQVSSLTWSRRAQQNPHEARNMRNLSSLGLTPDQVQVVLPHLAGEIAPENLWNVTLEAVARQIPVMSEDLLEAGGIFALVGPTGVGKTTTVAKLAARFAATRGRESVALVTTDNYRIGAREQMDTFARIMGAPVFRAADAAELRSTLNGLTGYPLVLVDTAGMSQRDMRLTQQIALLQEADCGVQLLLAMAANAQAEMLQEVVDSFSVSHPVACILTKIDEASSLGGALSVLMRTRLPLAYVANGQKVPEDIFLAGGNEGRLMRVCAALMRRSRPDINQAYMADHFAEGDTHVCA